MKNREVYEKLKKSKEAEEELMKKQLKEKLSKQCFYHDLQKGSEISIFQQKKSADELTTSKTKEGEKFGNTILKGLQTYDEITQRNNENFSKLTISNIIGASCKSVSWSSGGRGGGGGLEAPLCIKVGWREPSRAESR